MLGRSGGYIPESAAQQHIMRPFISAIAYLHARASDYSPESNLFGTMCPHLQLGSSHEDIVASQPLFRAWLVRKTEQHCLAVWRESNLWKS